jgi:hypothetical protein
VVIIGVIMLSKAEKKMLLEIYKKIKNMEETQQLLVEILTSLLEKR